METVQLLSKMMEFRPVTADIERVNQLVDFMADYLRAGKLFVRTAKMGHRKILFAAKHRTKMPGLLMNAHLDVVPAPESMFSPKRRGAWLWGRGTNDCLGNCAVIAQALIAATPDADVGALFSTDEETGGATAVHMVARGYGGKVVLVMDGAGDAVAVAQKGILALRMISSGRACHSSSPWKGDNAVDRLVDAYQLVKKEFPLVRAGDEWHDTMSANILKAGTVFNRVPETAEMVLDIRYTEKTRPKELLRRLRRITGLRFEIENESPVTFTDENAPALRHLRDYMRKYLKRDIPFVRMNGATDARHFKPLKVPVGIIGLPGVGAHGADERVRIGDLRKYESLLTEYFSSSFAD